MLGLGTTELALGVFGHLVFAWIVVFIYRDAVTNDISYPRFWTSFCGGAFILGVYLFLFTDAPLTGVILTANTGFILYGYEREVSRESDPGRHPDGPLREE